MTHLHPRVGTLNSGKFYAFANGYDQPEVCGTLEEVEAALGLCRQPAPAAASNDRFTVTLRFQHPAWDEVRGIDYFIAARTKKEAIEHARVKARNDGHTGAGKGRYTFTAEIDQ